MFKIKNFLILAETREIIKRNMSQEINDEKSTRIAGLLFSLIYKNAVSNNNSLRINYS